MLRPPPGLRARRPWSTRAMMSRSAVSTWRAWPTSTFEPGPLRRGELSLEAVQDAAQHAPLPLVEGDAARAFPEPGLREHGGQRRPRRVDRPAETGEKPRDPVGDVGRAPLRAFQDVVVGGALGPNLRRHAVEALRASLRTGQGHVGHGAGDAAVPVPDGWTVTNHRCANPALSTGSSAAGALNLDTASRSAGASNQRRNARISGRPASPRRLEVHPLTADGTRDHPSPARGVRLRFRSSTPADSRGPLSWHDPAGITCRGAVREQRTIVARQHPALGCPREIARCAARIYVGIVVTMSPNPDDGACSLLWCVQNG